MTTRRSFIHWGLIVVIAAFGLAYDEASSQYGASSEGVTVVADNLTNPRGFTWGTDGTLYLALAGNGGETQFEIEGTPMPFFGGGTSSIATVSEGCPAMLSEGIGSIYWADAGWTWGAMDVAIFDGELYALFGGSNSPDQPNGIYRVLNDGTTELVADLGTWNAENPTQSLAPDDDPSGSWFDLEAGSDGLWATEAVRGRVVTVTTDGQIEQVVDLSEGHMVPTGLALDGEGGAYVGFETTVPYPDGSSKIVHVAGDGTVTDYLTGLTAVTDIAMGPDGMLYISEMATNNLDDAPYLNPGSGRIVREDGTGGFEEVVTGIDYPAYLGFDNAGALYLTTPAFGPDKGVGHGKLVQVDLTSSLPVTLDGIQEETPTCQDSGGTTDPTPAEAAVSIQDFSFNDGLDGDCRWDHRDLDKQRHRAAHGDERYRNLRLGPPGRWRDLQLHLYRPRANSPTLPIPSRHAGNHCRRVAPVPSGKPPEPYTSGPRDIEIRRVAQWICVPELRSSVDVCQPPPS